MSHADQPARRPNALNRGFSLIELLVVLLILTVVIAIVIPGLQSFRNSARKSATTSLLASLATSVSQFKLSQSRLPGYFSAKDMGANTNFGGAGGGGGFSAMENMILDLAGGVTTDATSSGNGNACDPAGFPVIEVGPSNAIKVNVDINRIGAAEGGAKGQVTRGYFKPDPKYFVRQCRLNQRQPGNLNDARSAMPVMVDAWGQPLLAWVADEVPAGFALSARNSDGQRAKFYQASNACFTEATSLGKLGMNQQDPLAGSLLASNNGFESIRGIVGNPAFAGESRGSVVFQSAGSNGIYVGRSERGGKQVNGPGGGSLGAPGGRDYFQEGDFDDFIVKGE